jgi:DNA polymerase-3 subunit delta'
MALGAQEPIALPWLDAPLRQALEQQRAHAVLVQAGAGVGTLEFMLTLAQAWLCEGQGGARPCGACASCHLVQARSHPDLQVLLPEAQRAALGWSQHADEDAGDASKAKRKPSRQIKIDEVRSAIDWIVQTSSRGRAKVLVLHPAEAMNSQAASALLKTLEEPPGRARLLLGTVEAEHLLPTLRSRCQRLILQPPSPELACAWLADQGVADAPVLLAACAGQPLEARAMAATGIGAREWLALPRAVAAGQCGVFAGWPIPRVVDALQKVCHDAMLKVMGGAPSYFAAQSVPQGASMQALAAWARSLARVATHDEHPWNEGLLVEALVCEGRATWEDGTTAAAGTR